MVYKSKRASKKNIIIISLIGLLIVWGVILSYSVFVNYRLLFDMNVQVTNNAIVNDDLYKYIKDPSTKNTLELDQSYKQALCEKNKESYGKECDESKKLLEELHNME